MPADLWMYLQRYVGELTQTEYQQACLLDEAGRDAHAIARIIWAQRGR